MINRLRTTPGKILLAIAAIAIILLVRFCMQSAGKGSDPEEISIRMDAAPARLNPFLSTIGADIYVCARIFQSLGDLDPATLELTPLIVKSLPSSRLVQDGPHKGELAYDYELLEEARWDNGTPVTGKDVDFSIKIAYHPLLPTKAFGSYFKELSGIDLDPANPKKFTVYFRKYYMLAQESMALFPVLPAYQYDPVNRMAAVPLSDLLDTAKTSVIAGDPSMKTFAEEFQQPKFLNDPNNISGSGPYKVASMNDQGAILVKKENWWGDAVSKERPILAAYPKRLVYKVVKDENVVENMLKSGQLDIVAGSLSPARFLEMKQKDSLNTRYDFDLLPALQYNRWLFNMNKPVLKDVQVRKALAHVVDYDHFINNIRSGLAVRTVSNILPAKRYYARDITPYDYNIEKARELLATAGWSDTDGDGVLDKVLDGKPTRLVIEVLVPSVRTSQQYAESVTQTARLAGIEIKTVPTDITEINPKTKNGDFETTFLGATLFPGLTEMRQRYHSSNLAPAGDNRSRVADARLDEVIDRIGAEPDETKRDQLYMEAQHLLHEILPEVFLFAPYQPIITSKRFEKVITANRPGYYEQMFRLK